MKLGALGKVGVVSALLAVSVAAVWGKARSTEGSSDVKVVIMTPTLYDPSSLDYVARWTSDAGAVGAGPFTGKVCSAASLRVRRTMNSELEAVQQVLIEYLAAGRNLRFHDHGSLVAIYPDGGSTATPCVAATYSSVPAAYNGTSLAISPNRVVATTDGSTWFAVAQVQLD